ncbi:uncharacterized protein K489DRAFT_407732 [Dissoconium aciculare CBS 342.82]|uniref:F-box domain-containing protein n=1 Tax=Dissoconium aciculare CBS 342.82 TaxID=1314786 RepID=A0A6J3MAH1_9PEZI|nr:uncharacterized protein K489DRAFT_407732 [Dissoconium aciculare CBS 342.82]KAF1825021.1 hypothetical protein K489DRAFT_407732 [Dissoconium aciculare CBS 342.82]
MLLVELPVELLIEIMYHFEEIASALKLSATNRMMRAIWHENTTSVVQSMFEIRPEDVEVTLELCEIEEASIAAAAAAKQEGIVDGLMTDADDDDDQDQNARVRRTLFRLQRSADAVARLKKEVKEVWDHGFIDGVVHVDATWNEEICYPVTNSDYWQAYTRILRLAVAYQHEQFLPAACESMCDSSVADMDFLWKIDRILYIQCDDSNTLRQEDKTSPGQDYDWWNRPPSPASFYMPTSWDFALETIALECEWCLAGQDAEQCRMAFEVHHHHYGQELVAEMYGADRTPWMKWSGLAKRWENSILDA